MAIEASKQQDPGDASGGAGDGANDATMDDAAGDGADGKENDS